MFKKIRQNRGFTLVEMLVSMAIFVTFTGILINSYVSIVTAQREANDYRIMYTEARRVFDSLIEEFRDGMVDYGDADQIVPIFGPQQELTLISKDGLAKTYIDYEDGVIKIQEGDIGEVVDLNSAEVKVTDFKIYVTPSLDPYDQRNVENDYNQFHPKVTIYAVFERTLRSGKVYTMDLQTSVSSRIYNHVYDN